MIASRSALASISLVGHARALVMHTVELLYRRGPS